MDTQKRFRVVRGTGKCGIGAVYRADTARDAVAQDEIATRALFHSPGPLGIFAGTHPDPIIAVFELVPIPESDWR